jgi:hypothetical protein
MSVLYHATKEKMARKYRESGRIFKPVRGFTTLQGAMAWAIKTGRKVIYEIEGDDDKCHKLPHHHNLWGEAWWFDQDVYQFRCVFSAESDA